MGSGETALLLAAYEATERENSDFETMIRQEDWQELNEIDRALDRMVKRAIGFAREALTAAGYHQHHRGDWRKRRVKLVLDSNPSEFDVGPFAMDRHSPQT
jgi:hypothetical protein